jgi:hypothetical protein
MVRLWTREARKGGTAFCSLDPKRRNTWSNALLAFSPLAASRREDSVTDDGR